MSEQTDTLSLLKDFEAKEEELKRVRAKYIGISPGPSFNQHDEHVLTPEAIDELSTKESEMHDAWLRFISAAKELQR